ncbi:MAG: hypothetical protein HPY78_03390 [Brevinematales bacterium]|nr:hypothetical protein [Brevinematales bacterium]
MIVEIKEYFKELIQEITPISSSNIFFSLAGTNQYTYFPWARIVTGQASVKEVNSQQRRIKTNEGYTLVVERFSVSQPLFIALGSEREEDIDTWFQVLLQRTKRYLIVDNRVVMLTPTSLEFSDATSVMSGVIGVLKVLCEYGVYTDESFDSITSIDSYVSYENR